MENHGFFQKEIIALNRPWLSYAIPHMKHHVGDLLVGTIINDVFTILSPPSMRKKILVGWDDIALNPTKFD